jgi:hypothetical protein
MRKRHPLLVLGIFLRFVAPFVWASLDLYRTKAQIKRHQDPEELRAWALNLVSIYSASNSMEMIPGTVTNRPPPGIPTSGRLPRVAVLHDHLSDGSYNQWHIALLWGTSDFAPSMAMFIGDTNFVCSGEAVTEWKPGIYFSSQ